MHINAAMQKSVRRGVSDIFFDSLLGKRSITGEVSNVKNTFSSWDTCMAATYCKWPVIAIIIVGGLFIFSVLWCIIRCACCGMSCCCSCFSFMSCCDCCGGSCDGKKNKPHKHLDDPHHARGTPGGFGGSNHGYQAPAPMMGGALNSGPTQTTGLITSRDPPTVPQYAQFEVGKNGLYVEPKPAALSDDALPPMPSWESAASKKVQTKEEENAVEMSNLEPSTSQNKSFMTGAASSANGQPPSPVASPYGPPSQAMGGNGYIGVAPDSRSPIYGQNGSNNMAMGGNRGGPPPGPGRGGPIAGYGGPGQDINNGNGGYFEAHQDQYDQYGNDGYGGAVVGNGYGRSQPQRQYQHSNNSHRNFPPQPSRQYSNDSARPLNPGRQYSDNSYNEYAQSPPRRGPSRGPAQQQAPQRMMSTGPNNSYDEYTQPPPPRGPSRGPGQQQAPQRVVSPGLINSGGFDFGTGAQPHQRRRPVPQSQPSRDEYTPYAGSTAPPSYASRSPPPQEPAYPGYKPYTPPPQMGNRGGGAPDVLTPGGGRGKEPSSWDPVR